MIFDQSCGCTKYYNGTALVDPNNNLKSFADTSAANTSLGVTRIAGDQMFDASCACMQIYNGSCCTRVIDGATLNNNIITTVNSGLTKAWLTTGNAGNNNRDNFLGTTNFQNLNFRVANVRAGFIGYNNLFMGINSG